MGHRYRRWVEFVLEPGNAYLLGLFFALGGNVLPNARPDGAIVGGQIGCDQQFSPNWVMGFVADLQATNTSDSASATVSPASGGLIFLPTTESNSAKIPWLGTLRGRIGITPADNFLIYGTGGLAYGEVKTNVSFSCPDCPALFAGSQSRTKTGWTVGAGLEVAFAPKWTLGLEYLYFDLGKVSTTTEFVSGDFPDVTLTAESKIAGDIARVLLNYRFY